jgi:hypothetical protein
MMSVTSHWPFDAVQIIGHARRRVAVCGCRGDTSPVAIDRNVVVPDGRAVDVEIRQRLRADDVRKYRDIFLPLLRIEIIPVRSERESAHRLEIDCIVDQAFQAITLGIRKCGPRSEGTLDLLIPLFEHLPDLLGFCLCGRLSGDAEESQHHEQGERTAQYVSHHHIRSHLV